MRNWNILVVVSLSLLATSLAEPYEEGAYKRAPKEEEGDDVNQVNRGGKAGLDSTRSVLADIAREMVTRSATNSQVLSLNLTNLLILVVLKVVVFGAGMFGFNFLNKPGYKRSDDEPLLSESELLLLLSYLMGDAHHKYDCLHRVACEEPAKAKEYVVGAKVLLKGAKFFDNVVTYNPRYEKIVGELQEAVDVGLNGGQCEKRYKCSNHAH